MRLLINVWDAAEQIGAGFVAAAASEHLVHTNGACLCVRTHAEAHAAVAHADTLSHGSFDMSSICLAPGSDETRGGSSKHAKGGTSVPVFGGRQEETLGRARGRLEGSRTGRATLSGKTGSRQSSRLARGRTFDLWRAGEKFC